MRSFRCAYVWTLPNPIPEPTSKAASTVSAAAFQGIATVSSPPYARVKVPPVAPLVDTSCTSQGRPVTTFSDTSGAEARIVGGGVVLGSYAASTL